jgi:hypothetical protein
MKIVTLALACCVVFFTTYAQLQSPDAFLGYTLGTKWTQHHKIVNYFKHVAKEKPSLIKLQTYGTTNEGRELLLAFVSTEQNINNLEAIRAQHISALKGGNVASNHAIVWLSYNVHGNETSSSEVAMKTLYELASGKNAAVNEQLKNTVVIIDPCLNPDGRDRYVNWYTSVANKTANANPNTREHSEPWPGGRTNHYNFDLNRDWAWQTQTETQGRIKVYNTWLPHVHCDFHEQWIDNPYYFAPAAEPVHSIVTPWQRKAQDIMGTNHAKLFDANGWFYFTKEAFDIFYPSYGDSYPMYNGSIGMTYEQAGHSSSGLAVTKADGEILSLNDRIAHHFTTSLSTIDMASKNAKSLITEFVQYFKKAQQVGYGAFGSYVVKNGNNATKFKELLKRNDIAYSNYTGADQSLSGYDYFTKAKTANFKLNKGDIVIPAKQLKSALLSVLMEPQSQLSDSSTYDITAWALPFAYGLQTYGVSQALNITGTPEETMALVLPTTNYGLALAWQPQHAAFVGKLLQQGVQLKVSDVAFKQTGTSFERGTILILPAKANNMVNIIKLAGEHNINLQTLSGGYVTEGADFGSDKIKRIKNVRVALVSGKGTDANSAGEVWHYFEQELHYPINVINAEEVDVYSLKDIDVLIVPNGRYKFISDKEQSAELKTWVRNGGKLITMDNATQQLVSGDWGLKNKKADDKKDETDKPLAKYAEKDRAGISGNIPGAIFKVALDESHPLTYGLNNNYFTLKLNSNLYEYVDNGWNVGTLNAEALMSGFVGSKIKPDFKKATVFGTLQMGGGQVVFFADNPIFRSFWQNGKQLLNNAVFIVN